jgi:hypothetical protein
MAVEHGDGVEAVGVGDPACAASGYTRQPPANVVAAAEFGFFGNEEAEECPADISEADDGEVVGRNGGNPFRAVLLRELRYYTWRCLGRSMLRPYKDSRTFSGLGTIVSLPQSKLGRLRLAARGLLRRRLLRLASTVFARWLREPPA